MSGPSRPSSRPDPNALPPTLSAPNQAPPPPSQPAQGLTIADLLSQIEELRSDFEKFKRAHEASSSEESPSPSPSPQVAPTVLPNDPPSPPSSTSSLSVAQECTAHPDHPWLQPVLDHAHSPPFVKHVDSSMVPLYSHSMPDDVQQVLMVNYSKGSPRFLGIDSNGDLQVSAQCRPSEVKMLINLTEDDPQPPPIPSVFRL